MSSPVHSADGSSVTRRWWWSGMTHDSRLVSPGVLFACVRGHEHDGHALRRSRRSPRARHACSSTTSCRSRCRSSSSWTPGRRWDPVAAAVYGRPSDALTMVGITGTNGKTTTTHLLAAILRAAGQPTGTDRDALWSAHHAGGSRAAGAPGPLPGRRRRGRRDGGVLTRPVAAPGRRDTVRCCRLHEPRDGSPRSARLCRAVLPGQGAPVRSGLRRREG